MKKGVQEYLEFLEVTISHDKLLNLKNIIFQHQNKIPFDTVTKILSYSEQTNIPDYTSNLSSYLDYVKNTGYGGTCFNLTWNLYNLLKYLNYNTNIIHLKQGHFALIVLLDKKYYVDISLMAPLFEPLPLSSEWTRGYEENISWYPDESGAKLVLPNKTFEWDNTTISDHKFKEAWKASMDYNSPWLNRIIIHKWIDYNIEISCFEDTIKIFNRGIEIESISYNKNKKKFREILKNDLKIDFGLYMSAVNKRNLILNRNER